MNRKNKQNNIEKNKHGRLNKTKVIKISLSLLVVIIFAILFAVSLQVIKTTKIGAKVLDNLSGDTTEDVWQIIPASDEEETEENAGEVEDERVTDDESEVSVVSEETEVANIDDGIATIDDSSDYTITVTEYTGDTLEAEYDYENGYDLLYVVNGLTLEQQDVKLLTSTTYLSDYKIEKSGYNVTLNLFLYSNTSEYVSPVSFCQFEDWGYTNFIYDTYEDLYFTSSDWSCVPRNLLGRDAGLY